MDGADRVTIGAVVVVARVDVVGVEVEAVAVVGVVGCGRPEIAVRTEIVPDTRIVVAIARSRLKVTVC